MDRKRGTRDLYRPPRLRTPPAMPTGPRLYREPKDKGYVGPVADPPPGFVVGTTSKTEWLIYHALSKIMGYPQDPRQPPFIGMPGVWRYQRAFEGGRRERGGAVLDFVVLSGAKSRQDVAFRIQTEHFHIYASSEIHMNDVLQFERLSETMLVIDLYDQDFAFDPTNQAAIILIKRALNGEIEPNPMTDGTSQRVTRASYISV